MTKTIICQCFNEEYMLPWWLEHHKKHFDHGIIVDYHSTDRSREIVKEYCPTWEVRTSRNQNFSAYDVDLEMMDIEKGVEGWKITNNVTELIVGDFSILTDEPNQRWLIPTVFFLDTDPENPVSYDKPLWEQKHHGFSFDKYFLERRARSFHNKHFEYYPDHWTEDAMGPGRHFNSYNTDQIAIFYFGWCPWNSQQIARKTQIQTQIPLADRMKNWGFHHITNKETLEHKLYHEFMPRARDLTPEIKKYVN